MRKIIHCDCDSFYASVEMRDDPRLRGIPIAVGGSASRRGVIATCNYEARAYGVRSAMASAYAKKLCPELLIVPGRMSVYREVSQAIQAIFADYTPLIQPLSLDEAYLDVTDSQACRGSATLMAKEIRQRVRDTQGITVSAGVAPNKFIAKIASDWNKPDGLKVVLPDQVEDFLRDLPVSRLHGVGRKTANVVLNCWFGQETFAVDTHIFRVGNRTGLAKGKTPEQVEAKLEKRVPQPFRLGAHHWLILHGRYVCKARTPECWRCAVVDLCSYRKKVLEKPGRGNTKTGPG